MRCYYVVVHGRLSWLAERSAADHIGAGKPTGFYCHRYVLAPNDSHATEIAFRRVTQNLDGEFGWVRDGLATITLEATEVTSVPIHKVLKPDNRGHTFYE